MNSAYKILPYYTYEDYCRWEGQWEIIEGIPYAMSPMPRPEHQAVATNLAAELRSALKASGCSCTVYQPIDYKVTEDTVLNPDLLIVCQPIIKAFLDFAPALVVEILSPATALKDRHTKFEIYRQQQIPYYLIVDVDTKTVEVYQLDDAQQYQQLAVDQQKPFQFSLDGCSFPLVFEAVWS
jgi:Uma2 family endonuclease